MAARWLACPYGAHAVALGYIQGTEVILWRITVSPWSPDVLVFRIILGPSGSHSSLVDAATMEAP